MIYKGNTLIPQLVVETQSEGNINENLVKQITGTDTGVLDLSNETFTNVISHAFAYSTWSEVKLPNTVSNMAGNVFNNASITTFNWPTSLVDVRLCLGYMFYTCTSLLSVTIPTTTYINRSNYATSEFSSTFAYCTAITNIDIGTQSAGSGTYEFVFSNNTFGSNSYSGLPNLTSLTLRRTTLIDFSNNTTAAGYLQNSLTNSNLVIYVPSNLVSEYQAHEAWGQFNISAIS